MEKVEFQKMVSRLLRKIAAIVQAEKVVILIRYNDSNFVFDPLLALGVGYTGKVPATGAIRFLLQTDRNSCIAEKPITAFERLNAGEGNFICARIAVSTRDDAERVIERKDIGIIFCFRKRYQQRFNDDDARLIEMLADQAAEIINLRQIDVDKDEEIKELNAKIAQLLSLHTQMGEIFNN